MSADAYVYVNYARHDVSFVSKLTDDLRRHGIETWRDLKQIEPGVDWVDAFLAERKYAYWDYNESDRDYHTQLFTELESVIIEASATLSIISPEWKRSTWTIKEYLFSEEVDVPVFLLRAKAMPPTLAIAGVPYIDFVRDRGDGLRQLDRELRRAGL